MSECASRRHPWHGLEVHLPESASLIRRPQDPQGVITAPVPAISVLSTPPWLRPSCAYRHSMDKGHRGHFKEPPQPDQARISSAARRRLGEPRRQGCRGVTAGDPLPPSSHCSLHQGSKTPGLPWHDAIRPGRRSRAAALVSPNLRDMHPTRDAAAGTRLGPWAATHPACVQGCTTVQEWAVAMCCVPCVLRAACALA